MLCNVSNDFYTFKDIKLKRIQRILWQYWEKIYAKSSKFLRFWKGSKHFHNIFFLLTSRHQNHFTKFLSLNCNLYHRNKWNEEEVEVEEKGKTQLQHNCTLIDFICCILCIHCLLSYILKECSLLFALCSLRLYTD